MKRILLTILALVSFIAVSAKKEYMTANISESIDGDGERTWVIWVVNDDGTFVSYGDISGKSYKSKTYIGALNHLASDGWEVVEVLYKDLRVTLTGAKVEGVFTVLVQRERNEDEQK